MIYCVYKIYIYLDLVLLLLSCIIAYWIIVVHHTYHLEFHGDNLFSFFCMLWLFQYSTNSYNSFSRIPPIVNAIKFLIKFNNNNGYNIKNLCNKILIRRIKNSFFFPILYGRDGADYNYNRNWLCMFTCFGIIIIIICNHILINNFLWPDFGKWAQENQTV